MCHETSHEIKLYLWGKKSTVLIYYLWTDPYLWHAPNMQVSLPRWIAKEALGGPVASVTNQVGTELFIFVETEGKISITLDPITC